MHRVRDQQGRFISSSKSPRKTNSVGHSQEGKENNQLKYFSPTTSSLSKKRLGSYAQESETVQVSMQMEIFSLEDFTSKQFLFGDSFFLNLWNHLQKQTLRGRWHMKFSRKKHFPSNLWLEDQMKRPKWRISFIYP